MLLLLAPDGQSQTGKIAGRVTDAATGESLPGVNVIIEGTSQGAATDFDGEFAIIGVRPDEYTVVVSYIGYQSQRTEGVRVRIDLTTRLDVDLSEEVFEGEEVIVQADRPLIQRDLTATTAFVSGDEIRAIPVENFSDVVELQAGVVDGHFRGGRTGEVGYWIDGIPVTEARDSAVAAGIVINGLPLMTEDGTSRWGIDDLDIYYEFCVIGGPGAFVIPVLDWGDFPMAVRRKLVLELVGPPEGIWMAGRTGRTTDGYDCLVGEKLRRERDLIYQEP